MVSLYGLDIIVLWYHIIISSQHYDTSIINYGFIASDYYIIVLLAYFSAITSHKLWHQTNDITRGLELPSALKIWSLFLDNRWSLQDLADDSKNVWVFSLKFENFDKVLVIWKPWRFVHLKVLVVGHLSTSICSGIQKPLYSIKTFCALVSLKAL